MMLPAAKAVVSSQSSVTRGRRGVIRKRENERMSKKDKNKEEELPMDGSEQVEGGPLDEGEGQAVPAGDVGPDSAVTQSASAEELDLLTDQLAQAESRAAEYLEGWQRAQAEFANYKRRLERDNAAFREIARGDVIKRFLPVVDDLERALASRPAGADAWAGGIELVYRKLLGILESEGLQRIDAEGKTFDPNLHEAITQEHNEDFESGQVIEVVQQGYILGDRVIRHALVRVAA
jgi:molecular chaperone GrpE